MSWSVTSLGKAPAVAEDVAAKLAAITCAEPEQTIKGQVGDAIQTALASFEPEAVVRVIAAGSQYTVDGVPKSNTVSMSVEPLYGFVG